MCDKFGKVVFIKLPCNNKIWGLFQNKVHCDYLLYHQRSTLCFWCCILTILSDMKYRIWLRCNWRMPYSVSYKNSHRLKKNLECCWFVLTVVASYYHISDFSAIWSSHYPIHLQFITYCSCSRNCLFTENGSGIALLLLLISINILLLKQWSHYVPEGWTVVHSTRVTDH